MNMVPDATSNGVFTRASAFPLKGPVNPNGTRMYHGQNSAVHNIPTTGKIHNIIYDHIVSETGEQKTASCLGGLNPPSGPSLGSWVPQDPSAARPEPIGTDRP